MSQYFDEEAERPELDAVGERTQDVSQPVDEHAVDGDRPGTAAEESAADAPAADEPADPPVASAPETGDLVIDASLRDLAEAPEDDLDALIERGEQVQRTLQGRLGDLGG